MWVGGCAEERGKLLETIVTESNIGADLGPLSRLFDFSGLKVCVRVEAT